MIGRELIFPKNVDNRKISEIWDFYDHLSLSGWKRLQVQAVKQGFDFSDVIEQKEKYGRRWDLRCNGDLFPKILEMNHVVPFYKGDDSVDSKYRHLFPVDGISSVADFYDAMLMEDLQCMNQILHRRGYNGIDRFIARKSVCENCKIDGSEGIWDLLEVNGFIVDEQFSRT